MMAINVDELRTWGKFLPDGFVMAQITDVTPALQAWWDEICVRIYVVVPAKLGTTVTLGETVERTQYVFDPANPEKKWFPLFIEGEKLEEEVARIFHSRIICNLEKLIEFNSAWF